MRNVTLPPLVCARKMRRPGVVDSCRQVNSQQREHPLLESSLLRLMPEKSISLLLGRKTAHLHERRALQPLPDNYRGKYYIVLLMRGDFGDGPGLAKACRQQQLDIP